MKFQRKLYIGKSIFIINRNQYGWYEMNKFLSKVKEKINDFISTEEEENMLSDSEADYIELDTETCREKASLTVKTYSIDDFTDIKPILDNLRTGEVIALINIKPLKDKDLVELKRAINKLKKTTDAIDGDIAGFGEDYIVVSPAHVKVSRKEEEEKVQTRSLEDDEF